MPHALPEGFPFTANMMGAAETGPRGAYKKNSNTNIVAVASIYHGCHGAAFVTSASRFDTHRASALVYDDETITRRDSS